MTDFDKTVEEIQKNLSKQTDITKIFVQLPDFTTYTAQQERLVKLQELFQELTPTIVIVTQQGQTDGDKEVS